MNDEYTDSSDDSFTGKNERKAFVAKVYSILTLQLAFSTLVVGIITAVPSIREYFYDRPYIGLIFGILGLVVYLPLACCEPVRRSFPANAILLAIMTLCYAMMAGCTAARYAPIVVLVAFAATALITLTMTLVAKFGPFDVTGCGMCLCVGFLALTIYGIIAAVIGMFMHVPLLRLIFSGIAVLLLSFYLVFTTQLIMGGRMGEIGADEHILATIMLYTTIIDLFIHLLPLVQSCFESDD